MWVRHQTLCAGRPSTKEETISKQKQRSEREREICLEGLVGAHGFGTRKLAGFFVVLDRKLCVDTWYAFPLC